MKKHLLFGLMLCLFTAPNLCLGQAKGGHVKPLLNFSLWNVDGVPVSLSTYTKNKGVVLMFICNHCPLAKSYFPKLNGLNAFTSQKGFPLLAINPMDSLVYEEETRSQMKAIAKANAFEFPYLQDADQAVAKALQVAYTPEAYVLTPSATGWQVQYHGAIEYGDTTAAQTFVGQTVTILAQNKPVKIKRKAAIGCVVNYRHKK